MTPPLRELLLGSGGGRTRRALGLLTTVVLATFLAYALGLFAVSGGIIVIPGDATLLGLVVAATLGYRRAGLVFAWLALFAAYLGFHADWAFLGLSGRGLSGELAFFFDPVGLTVFAAAAVLLGTPAYGAGALARRSFELVRRSVFADNS